MIWADRLALAWGMILIFVLVAIQPTGGLAHSLAASNIMGGWGALLFNLVVIPWLILRFLDLIFAHRY